MKALQPIALQTVGRAVDALSSLRPEAGKALAAG